MSTLLWGDRQTVTSVIGSAIQTRELFRVNAPVPTCWRVAAANQALANAAVGVQLQLQVGIGRIIEIFTFTAPPNVPLSFEIPAQTVSARFLTDAAVAVEAWSFIAMIAPVVPWEGISVHVV